MLEPCLASNTQEVQTEGNSFSSFTSEQTPDVLYVDFMMQYTDDGLKKLSAPTHFSVQDFHTMMLSGNFSLEFVND